MKHVAQEASATAVAAMELVRVLQAELSATRKLAIASLGIAGSAIGATVVLGWVCA